MKMKKMASMALIAVLVLGLLLMTGCSGIEIDGKSYDSPEAVSSMIKDKIDSAYASGKDSVDITQDNAQIISDAVTAKDTEIASLNEANTAKDAEIVNLTNQLANAETQVQIISGDGDGIVFKNLEAYIGQNFSVILDDGDIAKLIDSTINFDSSNIDVKEVVTITADIRPKTSLEDDDFCDTIYLSVDDEKAILYDYIFDDEINTSDISEDEELNIVFLGKPLKIVGYDTADGLAIKKGTTIWLEQGKESNGVTLIDVSSTGDSAGIKVGDTLEWIDVGDSMTIEGVDVRVDNVAAVHEQLQDSDMAKLTINTDDDVIVYVEDGDEYVEDDETYVWDITVTNGILDSIGVEYDVNGNDLNDDYLPLKPGEKLSLPNDYVSFTYDIKYVADEYFDFEFDEFGPSDINTYEITASKDDSIVVNISEIEKINWDGTTAFFEDSNGDEQNSTVAPKLVIGDTELTLSIVGDILNIGTEIDVNSTTMTYLGAVEKESESNEVIVNGVNTGTYECEAYSNYGLIFDKGEDEDDFRVYVPKEQVELVLSVG